MFSEMDAISPRDLMNDSPQNLRLLRRNSDEETQPSDTKYLGGFFKK